MQGTAEENELELKVYQQLYSLFDDYAHVVKAQVPSVSELVELTLFDEFQLQKGEEIQVSRSVNVGQLLEISSSTQSLSLFTTQT